MLKFNFLILSILVSTSIACKGKLTWIELNNGNKIPMLGLGTPIIDEKDNDSVQKAVENAISVGYRLIDTAELCKNEEQVGRAIHNKIRDGTIKRENIFVITKLWNNHHARNLVAPALESSLKKLGLSYVDLYLMHTPLEVLENNLEGKTDFLETWKAMEECQEKGFTKSIGVSNFNESQIARIIKEGKIKPVVNEIEVHPSLTRKTLVKYCQDNNIEIIAHSPLGSMPESKSKKNSVAPHIDDPKLVEIAEKYNKTTVQIVLRYALDNGIIPIPRSSSEKRLKENIDVFDFCLTAEETKQIDSFNKNEFLVDFAQWKNFTHYPFQLK